MAFVHGFARTQVNGRKGWCAPVELGEAAPHYFSFGGLADTARYARDKVEKAEAGGAALKAAHP